MTDEILKEKLSKVVHTGMLLALEFKNFCGFCKHKNNFLKCKMQNHKVNCFDVEEDNIIVEDFLSYIEEYKDTSVKQAVNEYRATIDVDSLEVIKMLKNRYLFARYKQDTVKDVTERSYWLVLKESSYQSLIDMGANINYLDDAYKEWCEEWKKSH